MVSERAADEPQVLFADVVAVSAAVAADPRRSVKLSLLAEFLSRTPADEVATAVSVLSGSLPTPPLGVGPARLRAAWAESTSQTTLAIPGPALTLRDVERGLRAVAEAGGSKSVGKKIALVRALLERATPAEQDFLLRLCFGELRQGAL